MKYLLFNVAVAAALVFLFTADRAEVQKVAGQVHDAAGDVKAYASKALDTGRTLLKRDTAKPKHETEAPPPVPSTPAVRPPTKPVSPPAAARPEPKAAPPAAKPLLPRRLAANLPAVPEAGRKPAPKPGRAAAPVDLDPAVAQRRREVLDGIDTAAAVDTAPVLKEGSHLMTPSERRKELLSLAEEMELLYARSLSR